MIKLVLVRHGESIWNKENKFAGWTVGGYEGYNAGRKDQQEKNPSEWTKYDEQD